MAKYRNFTVEGVKYTLTEERYSSNNTLALVLSGGDYEGDIITVNLNDMFQNTRRAYLDTNNYPEVESILRGSDIVSETFVTAGSGFCEYPLYQFDF